MRGGGGGGGLDRSLSFKIAKVHASLGHVQNSRGAKLPRWTILAQSALKA